MVVPLFVGRPKSLKAISKALEGTREILVVTQKTATTDEPGPKDLYDVGTVGQILQVFNLPDGIVKILVEGVYRARVHEYVREDEFFEVITEEIPDTDEKTPRMQALMRNVVSLFEQYIKLSKKIPAEIAVVANSVESSGRLADIITSHLSLKVEEKQEILQAASGEERLERLLELLQKEIDIHVIEKKISDRVRKQMEHLQKEYYLREQMKAIQKELGDKDEIQAEIEEYKKRIAEAKMPEQAHDKCISELDRLAKMGYGSAESGVIRSYLDVMCDLPWSKSSPDNLDIRKAEKILERDHYGLKEPKERILEYLSVCRLKRSIKGPILCFMGPPGVGKTSLARSIAEAMGRKFVRMSLGGIRDEAEIRGHRKTYVGAMPGRIVQLIRRAGTNNPVFLLDEVDKTGADWRGDPSSALLEVLDPEQNTTFQDHYLAVPFDLSKVLFLTTANLPHPIPEPLRDRMEIINLPGYMEEEKVQIAKRHLMAKQLKENGLKKNQMMITDRALKKIIRNYTREAGIRELERKMGTIMRKCTKQLVTDREKARKAQKAAEAQGSQTGGAAPSTGGQPDEGRPRAFRLRVNEKTLEKYLGIPRYRHGRTEELDEVGVATGLAWTEVGGQPLPIEVVVMKGSGKLILTGHLGDVMQESARAAVTYVRSNYQAFGIKKSFYKFRDLHIHAPEGGMPKDGPSAGITIATAVVSALSGRKVNRYVALTGELTLKGRVLPVTGLKERVLAAFRTGIKEVVLSRENMKELEEIPIEIRERLKFHLVEESGEVLEFALLPPDPADAGPGPQALPQTPAPAAPSAQP
ncbi:MAG: endopeptidase La [Candidatus Riflebacteria bacterium]|nr:endopeptidase La [Candidatus Riflebacteria bacterium]